MRIEELIEHCKNEMRFAKASHRENRYIEHLVLLRLLEGSNVKELIDCNLLEV